MSHFQLGPDGVRRPADAAIQAAGPRHGGRDRAPELWHPLQVHGTGPVYLGPWPSTAFQDFCCDEQQRLVLATLQPVSSIRVDLVA